ncbi:ribonuclease H-like domain-containing protein, partial [Trametes punicea]
PWLLNLFDISAVAKTAQNLFQLIVNEVQYCIEHLSITLVAYCTDAAGDMKAMRDRLHQRFPWLITIDCWAHQMNLLVVDYFKHMQHYSTFMDQAEELIKWFNNHARALAMLKEEQCRIYEGQALSLLYPVTTRWSSRYIACKCLLDVKKAIQWLLLTKLDELVNLTLRGRNAEETSRKQAKARELFLQVRSAEFWDTLSILCTQLELFAVAINIAQADNTCLDTVLLALGKLVHTFSNRATINENDGKSILGLIERRWEKIGHDCEAFILALLLNPYIRRDCFNKNNPALTEASLWSMFKRLFHQVMQQNADFEVRQAFSDYLSRVGWWSDESMSLKDWKTRAHTRVNVVRIWRSFETVNPRGGEAFASFAARLLSIVPNTGATERDFSKLGTIHTKTRNRLKAERVCKTVLIHDYLARSHPLPLRCPRNSSMMNPETSDNESWSVTDNREAYSSKEASSRTSSQAAARF